MTDMTMEIQNKPYSY